MKVSACIEMLFRPEAESIEDRVRLAHGAGFRHVEFWRWSDKNLQRLAAVLDTYDMSVSGLCAEPMVALTDPTNLGQYLRGLEESTRIAEQFGTKVLIQQSGKTVQGMALGEQRRALVAALVEASKLLAGTGIRLALEPLNGLTDDIGSYLTSTAEGLNIVDDVGRQEVGLLYDLYHSAVLGEIPEHVLAGRVDRLVHLHVADSPGRGEPGTGVTPLAKTLSWLVASGYQGDIGLEFRPSTTTAAALERTARSLAGVLLNSF